jgi:hypothetical protein
MDEIQNEQERECVMSDESLASGLAQVVAGALHDERPVSIRIEGEPAWERVDRVNYGPHGPAVVEVRRAADGHTLIIPVGRVIAVDLGPPNA